jgi:hypothetical protein
MHGDNRNDLRHTWIEAWRKHRAGQPLEPLEAQIADVVALHSEYHALLEAPKQETLEQEWTALRGETNPFLHMGLHLALHEQLTTNRPTGIRALHQALVTRRGDRHAAEHAMIECLAEALWQAQRDNRPPDEAAYLAKLKKL